DGVNLGAEVTASPWIVSWDTTLVANGNHTLTAVARDAAGNTATSAAVIVTVNNLVPDSTPPAVSMAAPAARASTSGIIPVSASATDSVGLVGVHPKLDGVNLGSEVTATPYTISWNTTLIANGNHTLTAVASDAAGNTATSAAVSVTVNNPVPDTTPPTVTMTAPAAGATVAGTVTVSASASDNVGVVGVQFKLDGVNLGAEITATPYSLSWTTT